MSVNIAIDGPAGAGKSTIAKRIAKELSYIYVDTGAMYRAMAIHLLRLGTPMEDGKAIGRNCLSAEISITYENGAQQVLLGGENVTGLLRTEEVGNMASVSSAHPKVREKLLELQRTLAREQNVVMDGRDIGTTILPEADLKIYLTASVHTRALRRYEELKAKGEESSLEEIERDIASRDERDKTREISPLRQAEDAIRVDSSQMDIEEVTQTILKLFREKVG